LALERDTEMRLGPENEARGKVQKIPLPTIWKKKVKQAQSKPSLKTKKKKGREESRMSPAGDLEKRDESSWGQGGRRGRMQRAFKRRILL